MDDRIADCAAASRLRVFSAVMSVANFTMCEMPPDSSKTGL